MPWKAVHPSNRFIRFLVVYVIASVAATLPVNREPSKPSSEDAEKARVEDIILIGGMAGLVSGAIGGAIGVTAGSDIKRFAAGVLRGMRPPRAGSSSKTQPSPNQLLNTLDMLEKTSSVDVHLCYEKKYRKFRKNSPTITSRVKFKGYEFMKLKILWYSQCRGDRVPDYAVDAEREMIARIAKENAQAQAEQNGDTASNEDGADGKPTSENDNNSRFQDAPSSPKRSFELPSTLMSAKWLGAVSLGGAVGWGVSRLASGTQLVGNALPLLAKGS